MSKSLPFHWLVISLLVLFLGGCDGGGSDIDQQLIELKKQINTLNVENQTLLAQISKLQERIIDLEAKYENLKIKEADLSQWSQRLAERYGPSIWFFSGDERPLPQKSVPDATAEVLVSELNRLLGESGLPLVVLDSVKGNTAFVHVSDEEQLTQNMGTTGATAYIEVITYTLTSLKSLDFVEFRFLEGDHAIPGRYSR